VFCHTERLRNSPPHLKLVLSDSAGGGTQRNSLLIWALTSRLLRSSLSVLRFLNIPLDQFRWGGSEYDALRKLAHRLGIAIIVVHHCKKSSDIATAPLEKVIGSIGITGTAETILVMEQQTGSKDCKLYVTGKDVEQCEKYLSWNGHGFDIGDDVREAQLGSIQKLVLMLIRESPRCMQKHIVDTTGKDQGQISKAIDKLVEVGLVVRTEGRLMAQ